MIRSSIPVVAAVVLLLIGGCTAPQSSEKSDLPLLRLTPGSEFAWVVPTTDMRTASTIGAPVFAPNKHLTPVRSLPVTIALSGFDNFSAEPATEFVSIETGQVLLRAPACLATNACLGSRVNLTWRMGLSGSLFGLTAVSGEPVVNSIVSVRDPLRGVDYFLSAEMNENQWHLSHQLGSRPTDSFGCNIFEHDVVATSALIPTRCQVGNVRYDLEVERQGKGTPVLVGESAYVDAQSDEIPFQDTHGPFPAGGALGPSPFVFRQAVEVLLTDSGVAGYVDDHPNVGIASAFVSADMEQCTGTVCTRHISWKFHIISTDETGLEAVVTRSLLNTTGHRLSDSVERNPKPSQLSFSRVPAQLADPDEAAAAAAETAAVEWDMISVHARVIGGLLDPQYFFFTEDGQHVAQVDGVTGGFVSISVPIATANSLVRPVL